MFDTPPISSRAPSVTAGLEDFNFEASDLEDSMSEILASALPVL
jgi:hypothetical protein